MFDIYTEYANKWMFDIYIRFTNNRNHNPAFSLLTIHHMVCKKSNTTGATSGTETGSPSEAPEFTATF
jgi:hypothetical protein